MNSLKRFLFSAISIALVISGLLFSVSSFPEKAFAGYSDTLTLSFILDPSTITKINVPNGTLARKKGNSLSGVTVSDKTGNPLGNPLTVTITTTDAFLDSPLWKYKPTDTSNYVTSGTLAQVNNALNNAVLSFGPSTEVYITADNVQYRTSLSLILEK